MTAKMKIRATIRKDRRMKVSKSITELIGKTPLVELVNYQQDEKLDATILAKVEFFNPAGSSKDRAALFMIEEAEKQGFLKPGGTIIEPTSGNTGVGLAAIAGGRGYKVILTMPETMSIERRNLLKAYGAELVLTDGVKGMAGAIEKAKEILDDTPGAFMPNQFANQSNPAAHYHTTGPEIWEDTEGKVDIFIAGIGTGGTITGTGEYLKSKNPDIRVVGVEPSGSPFLTEGKSGPHGLQGIGAGFKPDILNTDVCDEIITVSEKDAYEAGRKLARREGLLVGITSGAAVHAAKVLAARPENRGKIIVAFLPDTGERYLSTPMFQE